MSDAQQMMDPERGDSRRLLAAFLAAVLLHVVIFIAFAIVRLAESAMEPVPVSVELMPGTLSGPALAGPPSVTAGQAPSARSAAQAGAGAAQGFVIPTPRQGAGAQATQPTGPAFRVAGPSSAQTSSAPQATSPVQEPVFPHVTPQQGTGAVTSGGNASAGGPARGQLVQGGGQAAAQGSLDLGSLEKSFANAQGSGAEPGTASGAGGGGAGGTAAEAGGGGGQGIKWDQPAAAAVRKLLASPRPQIPPWVSKQGLRLTVLVSFTLTPDGAPQGRERRGLVRLQRGGRGRDGSRALVAVQRESRLARHPRADPLYHTRPQLMAFPGNPDCFLRECSGKCPDVHVEF